jgi:uncharacterized protein (TIGR00266 family)
MEIDILHGPGNAAAKITFAPHEECTTEAGAMIAMSASLSVETTTHKRGSGSAMKALKRMLAGESLFLNHYQAGAAGGELWVAPTLAGDLLLRQLHKENLIVQGSAYLACEKGVSMDMNWQGLKSLLSGENLFWLNLSGSGKALIASFGAIYAVEVDGEYLVDTGFIVAFEETLNFTLTKAGKSWMSSILGGEGLVCKFTGKGTVWCQSHDTNLFGKTLGPMLKPIG